MRIKSKSPNSPKHRIGHSNQYMKQRAPRNQTITCSKQEITTFTKQLVRLSGPARLQDISNRIICQDLFACASFLPADFVDLLVLDPPYNLTKTFGGRVFKAREAKAYMAWFARVLDALDPVLKRSASIYVCSDWRTSNLVFPLLEQRYIVRNRITWERDKGRGAKGNWKNNTEDIWFCTRGKDYCFNVDAVKLKRRVLAPYRDREGEPKGWRAGSGGNFRLTHPSNIWNDITIPFWSMPENTDHPAQKPEKLMAKLILASSMPGDFVLDPFAGSGTAAVAARKLGRRFAGIERCLEYCCLAVKRLALAQSDTSIQGYADGVFWERNSLRLQRKDGKGER